MAENDRDRPGCPHESRFRDGFGGKGSDFARPVLVLKKLDANSFLAVPLTTQIKNGTWYSPIRYNNGTEARAILSQVKILDKKRLMRRIETMGYNDLLAIRQSFVDLYGPQKDFRPAP